MTTDKFRVPTPEEEAILRRNKIDPDPFSVILRNDSVIRLKNHITGDTITVNQGDRKWSTY